MSPLTLTVEEGFWSRVNKREDGCWGWRGYVSALGYGQIWVHGRTTLVHRYAYELSKGPIPDGKQIDHLCRKRDCVNPDHLEPVTARVNTLRSPIAPAAVNARKTRCIHGHDDWWFSPNGARRVCRRCVAIRKARSRAR